MTKINRAKELSQLDIRENQERCTNLAWDANPVNDTIPFILMNSFVGSHSFVPVQKGLITAACTHVYD